MTMLKQEMATDIRKDFMGVNQNFQYQNVRKEQNTYTRILNPLWSVANMF